MNQEVLRERLERIGFEIVPDRQVNKTTKLIMSESEYRKLEKLISEHTAVVEREARREIWQNLSFESMCPRDMARCETARAFNLKALNSKEKES